MIVLTNEFVIWTGDITWECTKKCNVYFLRQGFLFIKEIILLL